MEAAKLSLLEQDDKLKNKILDKKIKNFIKISTDVRIKYLLPQQCKWVMGNFYIKMQIKWMNITIIIGKLYSNQCSKLNSQC